MENLNKLTKAIQEAVPEVMELGFGCKIKYLGDEFKKVFIIYRSFLEFCYEATDEKHTKTEITPQTMNDFAILGRDIQLADVFRAINAPRFFIDIDGWIGEMVYVNPMVCERRIKWNLLLPLHLQNQETVDFLWGILGGEK